MAQSKKTAAYRVVTDSGGGRSFRFYCDISGELCCETKPIRADTEQAALEKAVELKLIDGFCIGDLAAEQMRTWLDETAETINGRSAR